MKQVGVFWNPQSPIDGGHRDFENLYILAGVIHQKWSLISNDTNCTVLTQPLTSVMNTMTTTLNGQ